MRTILNGQPKIDKDYFISSILNIQRNQNYKNCNELEAKTPRNKMSMNDDDIAFFIVSMLKICIDYKNMKIILFQRSECILKTKNSKTPKEQRR